MSFYLNMKKTINEDLDALDHYDVNMLSESRGDRKDSFRFLDHLMFESTWEIRGFKVLVEVGNDLSSIFLKRLGTRYSKKHKNFFKMLDYISKFTKESFYLRPNDVSLAEDEIYLESEFKPRNLNFYTSMFGSLSNFEKFLVDELDVEFDYDGELLDVIKSKDDGIHTAIGIITKYEGGLVDHDRRSSMLQYTTNKGEILKVHSPDMEGFIMSQGWKI